MESNPEIEAFILDLPDDKRNIVLSLRELVLSIAPDSRQEIKWGALVFNTDRPFCGIASYKNYVSVIFDRGSGIPDPDGLLEGKGKLMRHLKIHREEDIDGKNVGYYVESSFKQ